MSPGDGLGVAIFILVFVAAGAIAYRVARWFAGLLERWIDTWPEMDEETRQRVLRRNR